MNNQYIDYTKKNSKQILRQLAKTYQNALKNGDEEQTDFCAYNYLKQSVFLGQSIDKLSQEIANCGEVFQQLRPNHVYNYHPIYQVLNNPFIYEDKEEKIKEISNSSDLKEVAFFYCQQMLISNYFRQKKTAYLNAKKASNYLAYLPPIFVELIYNYHQALAHLGLYEQVNTHQKKLILQRLEATLKQLESTKNLHHYYIVKAEGYRLEKKNQEAIEAYDVAISFAQDNGYLLEEGLFNELAAEFYLELGINKIAKTYLIAAYYCYINWGAKGKLKDLENRYHGLLEFSCVVNKSKNHIFYCWDALSYRHFSIKNTEEILGYLPTEIPESIKDYVQLIHPEDRITFLSEIEKLIERKGFFVHEYRVLHKQGHYIWIEDKGELIDNKTRKLMEVIGLVCDITQRKQREAKLQRQKVNLEQSKNELKKVKDQAKTNFIANISHELRTPLKAILGFTQLMARDNFINEKQQEFLNIINSSGEHAVNFINNILEISKIESGKISFSRETLNLHELLDNLQQLFQLRGKAKGLNVVFSDFNNLPKYVMTDDQKLRQILINLLSNAVKFTEKGTVTLQIQEMKNQQVTWLLFSVEDTGIGIKEKEIKDIFEPFVQTKRGEKAEDGTGLELYITKEFINLMGGQITVNSQLGNGSCFQFEIPLIVTNEELILISLIILF